MGRIGPSHKIPVHQRGRGGVAELHHNLFSGFARSAPIDRGRDANPAGKLADRFNEFFCSNVCRQEEF